ncbi:MAG TPA: acetyl-CoA carboxylase, carboxyltransferase subunit beta [Verrucomicrobiae bacterium]|nr:acetyl-CoA carboxylase, carboxyltransferase subunit beta [Verrucomicrobiae bacterium]
MLKDLFRKPKYVTVTPATPRKDMPDGLWVKCAGCGEILFNKELEKNLKVCHKCGNHFRLSARERVEITLDEGSFVEYDINLNSGNPLEFPNYEEKLVQAQAETELKEGIVTGEGTINGFSVVIGVMDPKFIMGSMGSVIGEKICRAVERAIEKKLPVIIFSTSGGARMQEGILSLMQMAKTSAALARLGEAGLLYISVFTDPTFGGVTASFASLGDVAISEPGALIGFAGPRVIFQTMRQELPPGAQTAEFNMDHGLIDLVIERGQMKNTLAKLLMLHRGGKKQCHSS